MRKAKAINVGDRFGKLVVTRIGEPEFRYGQKRRMVWCRCDCGNEEDEKIPVNEILRGRKTHCSQCTSHTYPSKFLNGYRLIYKPEHFSAMKTNSYKGFVYEHKYIIECNIGRQLRKDEVVHHKDGDRANNRIENLILLKNDVHIKLHNLLNQKLLTEDIYKLPDDALSKRVESLSEKYFLKYCRQCGKELKFPNKNHLCKECYDIIIQKCKRPSYDELKEMLKIHSKSKIGRIFGVSRTSVTRWIRYYANFGPLA